MENEFTYNSIVILLFQFATQQKRVCEPFWVLTPTLGNTGVDNTPDYVENKTLLKEYIYIHNLEIMVEIKIKHFPNF